MHNYDYYLDKAKDVQGYKYDNQIDHALGFKGAMCCLVRQGKRHLSDDKMKALAKLAGMDEEIALLNLNIWRAPENVKSSYASILQKITQVTACVAVMIGFTLAAPTPSYASNNVSNDKSATVYYGKYLL
ncbi:MAG: hypothetical protein COB36_06155 [Alphaproteobacteria bacterium]|nr:MAG: hypothetical protein COB36_06155 [Alphaproteobacteria bacterium]